LKSQCRTFSKKGGSHPKLTCDFEGSNIFVSSALVIGAWIPGLKVG
jgi:hypothetical protein